MKPYYLLFTVLMTLSLCFSCEQMPKEQEQEQVKNNPALFVTAIQHITMVNTYLENSNEETVQSIKKVAKYKVKYLPLADISSKVHQSTQEMDRVINNLKGAIDKDGSIYYRLNPSKNSASSTHAAPDKKELEQILFSQEGELLYKKLTQLKTDQLKLLTDLWDAGGIQETIFTEDPYSKKEILSKLSKELLLLPNKETPQETWLQDNFKGKTIEEAYVTLTHLQNKVHLSASTLLKILSEQISRLELTYDRFSIIADAPQSTILLGEDYTANIILGAASSTTDFQFTVNDKDIPAKGGQGHYKTTPTSIGKKTYEATITTINALTGRVETFKKTFNYEVIKSK